MNIPRDEHHPQFHVSAPVVDESAPSTDASAPPQHHPCLNAGTRRMLSDIENKVISMYAKGMSTRDISTHLDDIYGIEASKIKVKRILEL